MCVAISLLCSAVIICILYYFRSNLLLLDPDKNKDLCLEIYNRVQLLSTCPCYLCLWVKLACLSHQITCRKLDVVLLFSCLLVCLVHQPYHLIAETLYRNLVHLLFYHILWIFWSHCSLCAFCSNKLFVWQCHCTTLHLEFSFKMLHCAYLAIREHIGMWKSHVFIKLYHFDTSDQRKPQGYISHIALTTGRYQVLP